MPLMEKYLVKLNFGFNQSKNFFIDLISKQHRLTEENAREKFWQANKIYSKIIFKNYFIDNIGC